MAAEPVTTSPLRVAIAGAGRVAVAVASLLQDRGHDVVSVWSRNPESTKRAARRLSAHTAPSVAAVAAGADLVLVGAVDDAIADVAADLAEGLERDTTVVHFAGVLAIDVLGAIPGPRAALHPVQSVPDVDVGIRRLPGSAWGVTVSPGAEDWAHAFVRDELRGIPVDVAPEDRALWHAAAVMTSNGIAALMSTGSALLNAIGVTDPQSVLGPLAAGTVANVGAMARPGDAFTGPVVRGDAKTVELHLAALGSRAPELVDEYKLAAEGVVAGAARTGRVDARAAQSMRDLLESA
ncbi:MAG TPA: DUF2520 domain-containing protein [Actinomycetota bacterium]